MADDEFQASSGVTSSDDLATAMALGARGTLDPIAASYLTEQTRLAQLQSQNLIEQNAFEVSHLKWRRFNDQLRGAWQTMAMLIGTAVFALIAALVWDAHEASGLVVQPLSAPPDFTARGLDGTVLAQRLLDKLNGLVQQSEQNSVRTADSIGGNWGDDSKVEIPQTGVSVSEFSRALRGWIGNETRVSGEVWRLPKGVAIAVRAGANPGVELSGTEADLDALIENAAVSLLEQTQPFRYANLKAGRGNRADAIAIFRRLAALNTGRERAWALAEIGILYPSTDEAMRASNDAVHLDPANPFAYAGRLNANAALGHGEATVQDVQRVLSVISGSLASDVLPSAVETFRYSTEAWFEESKGAYAQAAALNVEQQQRNADGNDVWKEAASNFASAHDGAAARAILAAHPVSADDALSSVNGNYTLPADIVLAIGGGDWPSATTSLAAADLALQKRHRAGDDDVRHTLIWPWLSYAWAKTGNTKNARDLIARTPHDCTLCLQMRGRIAEAMRDDRAAIYWYGRATDDAPSLPFAASDWAALLVAHHKLDAAIAKFRLANARGPHYADPLEQWGETLMLQNRSDLALAKFEEAARYAPNWGRLHLKWGEALRFTGHKAEAQKQFALASSLDLQTDEEAELGMVLGHE